MRIEEFVGLTEKVTGHECKNVSVAIKEAAGWLAARALMPAINNLPNLASALAAATTRPAATSLATIPSVLTVGPGCVQASATAAGIGRCDPPPEAAPAAPKISTEVIAKLAGAVFGTLPHELSRAAEPERREQCLRIIWTAHCEAALPPSLQSEVAGFCYKYWRPPGPTGYERSIAAMRQDSLKKLASKMNLS